MENILDAGYKLPESIKKELIKEGIDISNIELCTFIKEDKQSYLWYGGDVVKFNYKDEPLSSRLIFCIQKNQASCLV